MSLDKICYNVTFYLTKNSVNSIKFICHNFVILSKKISFSCIDPKLLVNLTEPQKINLL